MHEKMLVIHGGGPTAVMNGSLYGVLNGARERGVRHVYGAAGGLGGALRGRWLDLSPLAGARMEALLPRRER
jgi:6-phosphofructokinase 1